MVYKPPKNLNARLVYVYMCAARCELYIIELYYKREKYLFLFLQKYHFPRKLVSHSRNVDARTKGGLGGYNRFMRAMIVVCKYI